MTFEKGVFEPRLTQTTINFSEICGKSASPSWFSPGAERWCVPYLDVHLLRQVFPREEDPIVEDAWLGELGHLKHKLLLKLDGRWSFALMNHGDTAACVWPAEEHNFVMDFAG